MATTITAPTTLTNDPKFLSFIASVQEILSENARKFNHIERMDVEVEHSPKFTRVYAVEVPKSGSASIRQNHRRIFAFVATTDSNSVALGKVKRGDVMKPATYKAPARHARGNIYDAFNGISRLTAYGPAYL